MATSPRAVDRVFVNGRCITLNPAQPRADALAVVEGRIIAVGSDSEINGLVSVHTDVVDLGGKVVTPGFIETHAHLGWYSLTLVQADLQPWVTPTIAAVQDALRAAAETTSPELWVTGYGFDPNLVAEHRNLTRHDIDAVCPDRPVFITVGHASWVNTRTLEVVGITADSPDPDGGHFEREEDGTPNGVVVELAAGRMIMQHLPGLGVEGAIAVHRLGAQSYSRQGITTVHDPLVPAVPDHYEALQAVTAEADFPLRVVMFPAPMLQQRLSLKSGDGTDRLRVGPVKFFADGSIQYYTGALKEPYHSPEEARAFRCCGFRTIEPGALAEQVGMAHQAGCQVAIHANGDDAIDAAIDAIALALDAIPRADHRHRIEHCQTPADEQLARMAALGIHASFFIKHVKYYGDLHRTETLGPERAARISPLASAQRAGVRFALHSDSPVTPASPLEGMAVAVNRLTDSGYLLGADQRISAEAALRAYTADAAYLAFEENDKGTLEPGKFADLTILSDDPLTVDRMAIENIRVEGTVLGGVPVA